MVIATVFVVNAFDGLNTTAWTGWVVFAVTIGPILIWLFTVVYSDIAPGWFYTDVFGNNHFLFRSAYFWFANIFVLVLCLLPRYLAKAIKTLYWPNDVEIIRSFQKSHPNVDIQNHPLLGGRFKLYNEHGRAISHHTLQERPELHRRSMGSRTDMATGLQSVHRGFDFTTEEDGGSIRRMQSNLSSRHEERQRSGQRKAKLFSSLRRSMRRRGKSPYSVGDDFQ